MFRFCDTCGCLYEAQRKSSKYCSPACRARKFRGEGKGHNPDRREYAFRWGNCEYCGKEFDMGIYSYRGGKRQKRYCSDACRQAAWKAKKTPTGNRGSTKDSGTGEKTTAGNNTANAPKMPPHIALLMKKSCYELFEWKSGDGAMKKCKAVYRALCLAHHPDHCKDDWANAVMAHINAQWEKLTRWEQ